MTPKRELRLAVLLCLLGSLLVLLAVGQGWVTLRTRSLTVDALEGTVGGAEVVPGARVLGYVGLAGVVALAATRGWGRSLVGLLLVGAALGVVGTVATAWMDGLATHAFPDDLADTCGGGLSAKECVAAASRFAELGVRESRVWPSLALLGAALLAAGGLLVLVRGRRWAALSSSYQAPAARPVEPPVTDKGTWDALDRGDDPTA